MYMIIGGPTLHLDNLGVLSPGPRDSCPVCIPLPRLPGLPTPPLTQQEHPSFSFMAFIRQHGLVRWQCVLAPAYTAVFTTQSI